MNYIVEIPIQRTKKLLGFFTRIQEKGIPAEAVLLLLAQLARTNCVWEKSCTRQLPNTAKGLSFNSFWGTVFSYLSDHYDEEDPRQPFPVGTTVHLIITNLRVCVDSRYQSGKDSLICLTIKF